MSYCELVFFKDGVESHREEFRNSWGGSAYVWDCMFTRYLRDKNKPHDSWLFRQSELWTLTKRDDLPKHRRAVMLFTYDWAVVEHADFKALASDLRAFVSDFGIVRDGGEVVCHLPAWADTIEKSDADAVGLYGTSVGECLWDGELDEETEERLGYDLRTGEKHWNVYKQVHDAVAAPEAPR